MSVLESVLDGAKYSNTLSIVIMYYSYATLFISFAACVLEPVLAGAKYANALSIVRVSPSPVGPTVITKVNQGGKDGEQQYDEEKIMFWAVVDHEEQQYELKYDNV